MEAGRNEVEVVVAVAEVAEEVTEVVVGCVHAARTNSAGIEIRQTALNRPRIPASSTRSMEYYNMLEDVSYERRAFS
jgi:hypothetical protein